MSAHLKRFCQHTFDFLTHLWLHTRTQTPYVGCFSVAEQNDFCYIRRARTFITPNIWCCRFKYLLKITSSCYNQGPGTSKVWHFCGSITPSSRVLQSCSSLHDNQVPTPLNSQAAEEAGMLEQVIDLAYITDLAGGGKRSWSLPIVYSRFHLKPFMFWESGSLGIADVCIFHSVIWGEPYCMYC